MVYSPNLIQQSPNTCLSEECLEYDINSSEDVEVSRSGGVGQYVSFRGSRRGRNMGTKLKSIGLVVEFLTYLGVHISRLPLLC